MNVFNRQPNYIFLNICVCQVGVKGQPEGMSSLFLPWMGPGNQTYIIRHGGWHTTLPSESSCRSIDKLTLLCFYMFSDWFFLNIDLRF